MRERVRKKLTVPDLVGLNQRDAQATLRNSGFVPGRVRYVQSYEALDSVVEQFPLKGQLLNSNEEIEIKVAKRSYLQYLPQIFQVDSAMGNSFLREYLWIFQHIFDSLNNKLDDSNKYYDPRESPAEMLPWLASWVALSLDVDWPELNKRKLVRNAAQKYRNRGTRRSLEEMLGIFVGDVPNIEENAWPYPGFRIGVTSTMGEDSMILPSLNLDHCFIVHVPKQVDEISEDLVVKIHNIINMEKPAHATYCLQFSTNEARPIPQMFMQIGVVSTVGTPTKQLEEEATSTPIVAKEKAPTPKPTTDDSTETKAKSVAKPSAASKKAKAKAEPASKTKAKSKEKKTTKAQSKGKTDTKPKPEAKTKGKGKADTRASKDKKE